MWKWLRRILAALVLLLAVAVVVGSVWQWRADRGLAQDFPPTGQMVDIGGYRLHIHCAGEGSPTVLFESGGGSPGIDLLPIQAQLADLTRFCWYNRAGVGWSDTGPAPRDGAQIAGELDRLLAAAQVSGPYLLAGHSVGGLYVRIFAARRPGEIAGVVLLDSSHEQQYQRFPPLPLMSRALLKLIPLVAPLGPHRLLGICSDDSDLKARSLALGCQNKAVQTTFDELRNFEARGAQVRAAGSLGDLPLVLVTADQLGLAKNDAERQRAAIWMELQKELAGLSSNSSATVAKGCGHNLHLDCPQVVVDTLRAMVASVRQPPSRPPEVPE